MAKIAPFGKYYAQDSNGAPLAGGKLYTYDAGTSTPKTTYTDKYATSANTNPVVLDANGYADVWLDTGGYKFVLKDSLDNTIWTQDNIDGGSATGYAATVITKSSGFSLSTNEQNAVIACTSSLTISLLPVATAGDGFSAVIINTSSGDVTLDPDGAETINGLSTLIVRSSSSVSIHTDGTAWYATTSVPNAGKVDTTALADQAVTYAKIQNVSAQGKILARKSSGAGSAEESSLTEIIDTNLTSPAQGDILYRNSSGWTRLAAGTSGQFLKTLGAGANPAWATTMTKFESTEQSMSTSASATIAHGLGAIPFMVLGVLRCKTAEYGYSVGDEVPVFGMMDAGGNTATGLTIRCDATNISYARGSGSYILIDATTKGQQAITTANWKLILRAWV